MSTKPHKFWPPIGSVWRHWIDLLLATQLAALRAGFNYLVRVWHPASPTLLRASCAIRPTNHDASQCRKSLLCATAVDAAKPDGACQWEVSQAATLDHEAASHPEHSQWAGLSSPLTEKPLAVDPLEAGDEIVGFRALHTLEASIRADARRQGRFVTFGAISAPRTGETGGEPDAAFNCVLRSSLCPFLVRLRRIGDSPEGEPRWRCVEIRSEHDCISDAAPPQKRLRRRLDFFPSIMLKDGHVGKPMKRTAPKGRRATTQADEQIGPVPVRASVHAPIHQVRPLSPELFAPAHRSPCPSPPPLDSRNGNKPTPPGRARTPPAPASSASPSPSPSPAPARVRASAPEPPSSPAPATPAPPASPPPRSPTALLERRRASLASATSVLAALELAIEVQRALVDKKRRKLERAVETAGAKIKAKVQEVVEQVSKKPRQRRRNRPTRAERKQLKMEAQARGEAAK
ncbi:hypothetical protein JCM3775_003140 [Rhodotorula graminis]